MEENKDRIDLETASIKESVDWLLSVDKVAAGELQPVDKSGITINHDRGSKVIPCKICGKKGKEFHRTKRVFFGFFNGAHEKCIMYYCQEHSEEIRKEIESRGHVVLDEYTVNGNLDILLSKPEVDSGDREPVGATDVLIGYNAIGNVPCKICGKKGVQGKDGAEKLTYAFINVKHGRGVKYFCMEHAVEMENGLMERGIKVTSEQQLEEIKAMLDTSVAVEDVAEEDSNE